MKTKFFVHCPRGFANEKTLWGFNDQEVLDYMSNKFDDGMAGTWEQVDELTAKKLPKGSWYIEYAENIEMYPNWEETITMLTESSNNYYNYLHSMS